MSVSAVGSTPPPVALQRPPAAAPKDADGDHDGSTRPEATTAPRPTVAANGSVDVLA